MPTISGCWAKVAGTGAGDQLATDASGGQALARERDRQTTLGSLTSCVNPSSV